MALFDSFIKIFDEKVKEAPTRHAAYLASEKEWKRKNGSEAYSDYNSFRRVLYYHGNKKK